MDESVNNVAGNGTSYGDWCDGVYLQEHLWQFIKESSGQTDFQGGWLDWTRRHYSCQKCRKYDIVDTSSFREYAKLVIKGYE